MTQMSGAMRRMLTARERVARRNEWFGSIIYAARLVEDTTKGDTMCTDGLNIFFHPQFVADNDPHIEGVLLHEVLHCAFDHVSRRQWRDHGLFNIACDYAINPLVTRMFSLPKNALLKAEYQGLRAERIYDLLEKEDG